jgi:hypothetical protein
LIHFAIPRFVSLQFLPPISDVSLWCVPTPRAAMPETTVCE